MLEKDYSKIANNFNWGKTTLDYAKFRPKPPLSFYKKLKALDIGLPGQRIIDLGTGLGPLAIQFAKQNCKVSAIDKSKEQILMAKKIAEKNKVKIDFQILESEKIKFLKNSFDVATAMQSWVYFKKDIMIPKLKKILNPSGVLVIASFDHLPRKEKVAKETEKLILKYNPTWDQADWDGVINPVHKWAENDFYLKAMFYYDEPINFTIKSWKGRIRASQAISAYLTNEKVKAFDKELDKLLKNITKEKFTILHRISVHIFEFKNIKNR
jgi:cyclopropane fatty-acyl-phospholipid synthase-like methyltransferase